MFTVVSVLKIHRHNLNVNWSPQTVLHEKSGGQKSRLKVSRSYQLIIRPKDVGSGVVVGKVRAGKKSN